MNVSLARKLNEHLKVRCPVCNGNMVLDYLWPWDDPVYYGCIWCDRQVGIRLEDALKESNKTGVGA